MNIATLKEKLISQLEITEESSEWHELLQKADEWARKTFNNSGKIFAQIGLDAQPCPVNCAFCSLAEDADCFTETHILDTQSLTNRVHELLTEGIDELFLMTTASFNAELFLEYGKLVRSLLPKEMNLVANIGDFDFSYAQRLKKAGFTAMYHICRLGEGVDTKVSKEERIQSLNAARDSGLELYYCVEPIGPEHTNEEIATEIIRAIEYRTPVMAVMKRIAVRGTKLYEKGEISAQRLATICAAATLNVTPLRAMGVHEPEKTCLNAGANQLYAECGKNPRDTKYDTKDGRGFSVEQAKIMLREANWKIFKGEIMTEEEKKALSDKVYELGAYKVGLVDVADISVLEEFRAMCEQNSCGNYGKNYMCPPDAGDIKDLMAKLKSYHVALVYQTVNELEDSYDFEGMMLSGQKTNDLAQNLTQWLKTHDYTGFLHLGAGGCRVCEKCGKRDNIPCRFPDRAMASLETYGVNVSELAPLAGMKYINGKDTVTFFGSVFF